MGSRGEDLDIRGLGSDEGGWDQGFGGWDGLKGQNLCSRAEARIWVARLRTSDKNFGFPAKTWTILHSLAVFG